MKEKQYYIDFYKLKADLLENYDCELSDVEMSTLENLNEIKKNKTIKLNFDIIKQKYPKSFERCLNWWKRTGVNISKETMCEFSYSAFNYSFFDDNNIFIIIDKDYELIRDVEERKYLNTWNYKLQNESGYLGIERENIKSRFEAEQEAFMKSFEYLEKKLNEK